MLSTRPAVEPTTNAHALAGARILVADDSAANRQLVAFCLERAGASVLTVADGAELLDELTTGAGGALLEPPPVDLLLTDLEMPGMDGLTAVRKLRELGSALPIAALTGHADAIHTERCLAAGCHAVSTKPIQPERLLALCITLLGRNLPPGAVPGSSGSAATAATAATATAATGTAAATVAEAAKPAGTVATLRSELAADPDLAELVRGFIVELGESARSLEQLHRDSQLEALASLAHRLKGSGGSYGFPTITTAARELEVLARAGGEPAALDHSVRRLVELCRAAWRTPQS